MTRTELVALLSQRIASRPAHAAPLGVMLVQLQRLREFRLIYGYAASDALSTAAYDVLRRVLRPSDVITAIGEHQFVVFLPDLHDLQHATLAGSRVVREFKLPLHIDTREALASVAVGISVCPEHGLDPEVLLRRAELALGDAMHSTERSVLYAGGDESTPVSYEMLRDAIDGNRLEVHLQPILDLRTNTIVGAESLARWHEPGRGMIAPDQFISLAEETGLISGLTRWSVNSTMRHAASARRMGARLGFSINLSPRVFDERDIVVQITSALKVWDLPPTDITLEVTETALMEDPALSLRLLNRLREEGFGISIDDFGAGYSSLAYLKQFPATELKIDHTFVKDMQSDARSVQLVRSIVDLGHHLQMSVVAEGVEDAETLELLAQIGCNFAQGYYICRPQPAAEFIADLVKRGENAVVLGG
ncbi:MAG: putative bifunctional diguanylate cyclase/phosphodiesterase [Lysobacter sp.]